MIPWSLALCLLPDHLHSLLPLYPHLVPFFPPVSTALESDLGEAVFLPCSPQPISSGGSSEVGQRQGFSTHSPAEYSINSPHTGDGHWLTHNRGRWGTKMPGPSPTHCAFLQGIPQPGNRSRGVLPPAGNAQTLPVQTLQYRHCPTVPREAEDKQDSPLPGFPLRSLRPLWLRPFQLFWVVKNPQFKKKLVIRVFWKKQQPEWAD